MAKYRKYRYQPKNPGAKHFVGRQPLKPGSVVELTDAQAAAVSDRFVPVDPTQPSGVGKKPAGVPGDQPPPDDKAVVAALEGTVADAAGAIAKFDAGQVAALLQVERKGKSRKGVLDAAEARLAELREEEEEGEEEDDDDK